MQCSINCEVSQLTGGNGQCSWPHGHVGYSPLYSFGSSFPGLGEFPHLHVQTNFPLSVHHSFLSGALAKNSGWYGVLGFSALSAQLGETLWLPVGPLPCPVAGRCLQATSQSTCRGHVICPHLLGNRPSWPGVQHLKNRFYCVAVSGERLNLALFTPSKLEVNISSVSETE